MHNLRILELAEHLLTVPAHRFNMEHYCATDAGEEDQFLGSELESDCGTMGCIAGWACALFTPHEFINPVRAAKALGLNHDLAFELFLPSDPDLLVTPQHAHDVLVRLSETGEVHWTL